MDFEVRTALPTDVEGITELIRASVRGLQGQYTEAQREAALRTIFTVDSRLIADGTYFVAMSGDELAGCGGWSFRKTLYGGDHQVVAGDGGILDPATDAAKVRAIFVHPRFARMGLGSVLLKAAEDAAVAAGFRRFEMGSTLAGVPLYTLRGYQTIEEIIVPVGVDETLMVVKMVKTTL
jgi:GNAT superfamily N-acetyltransferase